MQKSTAYRAFETSSTAHDTQSTVDKVAHARKRRVIGQAFSDSAIRSFEDHVLGHVKSFVTRLSAAEATSESLKDSPWSSDLNMASWCKCLSRLTSLFRCISRMYLPWRAEFPSETFTSHHDSSIGVPTSIRKSTQFRVSFCHTSIFLQSWYLNGCSAEN